jgi:pimeloyl-ACP methyl ester carboxylesterase
MSVLEVPGARLYYEIHGSGPLMVMIPGAPGSADVFTMVTEYLTEYYTIVTYDRRGFSRSALVGPQDYDYRLNTDADDVRHLIEHLSTEPATVFGSSSGGVVALEVLTRYPSIVRTLAPFEPAALRQLPDGQKWMDFSFGLYDLYRQSGIEPALEKFRAQMFAELDRQVMARGKDFPGGEYVHANATYWFERELRQYTAVDLDLDALQAHANQIVLVVGRESRGYPTYEVNVELGKKLGMDAIELPGGHAGYLTRPAEFAREFLQAVPSMVHRPKT